MERREGWERRLADTIEAARGRAWAWGAHDCVSFALACIEAQTGRIPEWIEAHRGSWRSEIEAARQIRRIGGLEAFLARHARRADIARTGRGDVVLLPGVNGSQAIGVLDGSHLRVAANPGVSVFRPELATSGWLLESF